MAIWKDHGSKSSLPETPSPAPVKSTFVTGQEPAATPARSRAGDAKESLIAADLTIEGKIEGSGHIRIAGRFKGDVDVKGDLSLEPGANLTGGVRAKRVFVAGELHGNIDNAASVEVQPSGVLVGDLKAGSLTVAAGSRLRGRIECGWGEGESAGKSDKPISSARAEDSTGS